MRGSGASPGRLLAVGRWPVAAEAWLPRAFRGMTPLGLCKHGERVWCVVGLAIPEPPEFQASFLDLKESEHLLSAMRCHACFYGIVSLSSPQLHYHSCSAYPTLATVRTAGAEVWASVPAVAGSFPADRFAQL